MGLYFLVVPVPIYEILLLFNVFYFYMEMYTVVDLTNFLIPYSYTGSKRF